MNVFQHVGVRVGVFAAAALSFVVVPPSSLASSERISSPEAMTVSTVAASVHPDRKVSSTMPSAESDVPFQIEEGEGGRYTYELWQTLHGAEYFLFIWEAAHGETEEPAASYNFASAAEAVNFFTCRYARVRFSSCNLMISSVSYDIPETCVFPWANCTEFYEERLQD
ncbi:MAG: hypothetical protein AAGA75_11000 [Cyanobacteria bacterium P01_E01_bin.6]